MTSPNDIPRPPHLRWKSIGRFCVFAAAFLAPLWFLPFTVSAAVINKEIIMALLAAVAAVAFFFHVAGSREVVFPKSFGGIVVAAMVVVAAVGAWFSVAPAVSVYGALSYPDSLFNVVLYALLFFFAFYFLRAEDAPRLAVTVLAGIAAAGLVGILQLLGLFVFPWAFAKTNVFNTVGSPFAWGALLAAGIVMLLAADPAAFSKKMKWWLWGFFALDALGLVLLNYLFLWAAVAVAAAAIAVVRFMRHEPFRLPVIVIVGALFFMAVGSVQAGLFPGPAEVRLGTSPTLSIAKDVMWGRRALLGSGPATFFDDFTRFRPQALNQTALWTTVFYQGYSYAFTLLATGGILGFLALLGIVAACVFAVKRAWQEPYAAMIMTGVCFLVAMLFFYPIFLAGAALIFIGLGFAAACSVRGVFSFDVSRRRTLVSFAVLIVVAAAALVGMFVIGEKYAAAIEYGNLQNQPSVPISQAVTTMNRVAALDPQNDLYARAASQVLLQQTNQVLTAGTPSAAEIGNAFNGALAAGRNAIAIDGADSANWTNLGSLYAAAIPIASGADTMAENTYATALTFDPHNPQIPFQMAQVHILSANKIGGSAAAGQYAAAETLLKNALAEKPDYAPAASLLAQLYVAQGNTSQAIGVLQAIEAQNPSDAGTAFQIGVLYDESGQISLAQSEFERAVTLNPAYSNARYFLGLIYASKGLNQQAIAQFQAIREFNPDNATVKSILANLGKGLAPFAGVGSASSSASSSPQRQK